MKYLLLLLTTTFLFASCKKDLVAPAIAPVQKPATPAVTAAIKSDSIPDNAVLKIKLAKDSINSDETMFVFKKASKSGYDENEDGDYFPGHGLESLASVVGGKDLAVNILPYKQGMAIALDIHTKADGKFLLSVSYENKIPKDIQLWIKDAYLKDSVNVCTGNYIFSVSKADTASFGSKRFKLVVR